jgi:hypothetical protein
MANGGRFTHCFRSRYRELPMARILQVFAQRIEQRSLGAYGKVIAHYDAFAIVEVARGKGVALNARFPCEDITGHYKLDLGGRRGVPSGVAARHGAIRSGPTRMPDPGFHHYRVQFVGPVKRNWLSRVTGAGGGLRELYRDFTYIVRANARGLATIEALPFVRWVGHLPYQAPAFPGDCVPARRRPFSAPVCAPVSIPSRHSTRRLWAGSRRRPRDWVSKCLRSRPPRARSWCDPGRIWWRAASSCRRFPRCMA